MEERERIKIPAIKIFLRQRVSTALAAGTMNTKELMRYAFESIVSDSADSVYAAPIAGTATFNMDTMKGLNNEARAVAISTIRISQTIY